MHWIDQVAHALLERGKRHVVASGISISGHIHIGHANDVFIADAVRRSLEGLGAEAEAVWYADDFDPMRRIPWPLNDGELAERYKQYFGMPYTNIPSPDPKYESFVDYFSRQFVDSLNDFGIKAKIYSGAGVYRSGLMANLIRTALERAEEIREILNKFREKPLPKGWLPFDPLCENCGRIATTKAISWHGDRVRYWCEGTDYVAGCGHEGEADFTAGGGKLTWRVEWPARWKMLGVTCEPFGKDHAVVGGSYDTGKLIAERIFRCDPPYPITYEWVSLMGKRMSSSHGVVFTLKEWLEVAEPELLRYFIFRSKSTKSKGFDPETTMPDLYDEYDMVEQVYFKKAEAPGGREEQLSSIYEISQTGGVPEQVPQRVPFRFAAVLGQVVGADKEKAVEILGKRKVLVNPTPADVERAMGRISRAINWVQKYAPEHYRFTITPSLTDEVKKSLTAGQKKGLEQLVSDISRQEFTPLELHNHIYEVAKQAGIEPMELFKAIYLALMGRTSGPRAGAFISALERDFVVKRFREAAL